MSDNLYWWVSQYREGTGLGVNNVSNSMQPHIDYLNADGAPFRATLNRDGTFSHYPMTSGGKVSQEPNISREIHYRHVDGGRFKAVVKNGFVFHHWRFEEDEATAEPSGIIAFMHGGFFLPMIGALSRTP